MDDSRLLRAGSLIAEARIEEDDVAAKWLLSEAQAAIQEVLGEF